MAREYVCLYHSYLDAIEALGDAERGRLMTAMLEYSLRGAAGDLSGNEKYIWPLVKAQIDRDAHQYKEKCEANASNGKKGGRPKSQKNQTVFSETEENRTVFSKTEKSQGEGKGKGKDKGKGEIPPSGPPAGDAFAAFAEGNPQLSSALDAFAEMRKKLRKPLTERAKELTVADLKKLSANPEDWIEILNQSVKHSWQGVFPLKGKPQGGKVTPITSAEAPGEMELKMVRRLHGGGA